MDIQINEAPAKLEDLLSTDVVGTAFSDLKLWRQLDKFILDESQTVQDRAKACRKVFQITGEDLPELEDMELVVEHVRILQLDQ